MFFYITPNLHKLDILFLEIEIFHNYDNTTTPLCFNYRTKTSTGSFPIYKGGACRVFFKLHA